MNAERITNDVEEREGKENPRGKRSGRKKNNDIKRSLEKESERRGAGKKREREKKC